MSLDVNRAPVPVIEIQILGSQRIKSWRYDGPLEIQSRRAARHILALVAGSVEPLERDGLAQHFWPEHDIRQARNRLSHTLHLIRQAICTAAWDANWIFVQDELVFLDDRITTDIQRIRAAAAGGSAATNESLFLLYDRLSVPFDPDIEGPLAERIRTRLIQDQKSLQYCIADRMIAAGDIPAATAQLHRIVNEYPGDEQAFRQLMAFAGRMGRHHDVIRLYRQARKEMAESFGLKPSAQTQDMAAQAMEQIGRDGSDMPEFAFEQIGIYRPEPVDRLIQWSREGSGVLNLVGASGMGKSVILSQYLRVCAVTDNLFARFFDLSKPAQRREAHRVLSRAELTEKPDVVVLDHVLGDADLAAFSKDLPLKDQKLIIASRVRLALAMSVTRVAPLRLPDTTLAVSERQPSASMAVFSLHCQDASDLGLQTTDRHDLSRLLVFCAGWPALLRLAAKKCTAATPGETLRLASSRLDALSDSSIEPTGMKTGVVGQLFSESLDGTDPAVEVVGSLLALMSEPITIDQAVEIVEQVLPEIYSRSYGAIETLLDLGFVRADPPDGPPNRLSVAPLLAKCFEQYASSSDQELPRETVKHRLVAWLAEHIGVLKNQASVQGPSLVNVLRVFEDSRPLLLTLLQHGDRSEQVFRLAVLEAAPWLILRRSPASNEQLFSAIHRLAPVREDGAPFECLASAMRQLSHEQSWHQSPESLVSGLSSEVLQAVAFAFSATRVHVMRDVRPPRLQSETRIGVMAFLSRDDTPDAYRELPLFWRLHQLLLQDRQQEFEQSLLSEFRANDEQVLTRATLGLWFIQHCWRSGQVERAGHWVMYMLQYLKQKGDLVCHTRLEFLIRCQLACYMLMMGNESLISQLDLQQSALDALCERQEQMPRALSLLAVEASIVRADRVHDDETVSGLLPQWVFCSKSEEAPYWQSYVQSFEQMIKPGNSVAFTTEAEAFAWLDHQARAVFTLLR